jgi:hypothetical protein
MEITLKGMPRRSFLYALGIVLLLLFTLRWREEAPKLRPCTMLGTGQAPHPGQIPIYQF